MQKPATSMSPWSRGALFGIAVYGAVAHGLLLLEAALPDWLPALAIVSGLGAGLVLRGPARTAPSEPLPWWLPAAGIVLLLVAGALLTWGSVATVPRSWDGYVAWLPKARALAATPRLDQPFFDDPAVFAHSRSYPLLQPLLLAPLLRTLGEPRGQILFPLLWLLLFGITKASARDLTGSRRIGWLVGLAVALTPALINPSAGSVDSGYAELLLLLALTGAAAGVALEAPLAVWCAAAILPWVKPEGLVWAILLVAATTLSGPRRIHIAATLGAFFGVALWLPLLLRLSRPGEPQVGPEVTALPVAGAFAAFALREAIHRFAPRATSKALIVLGMSAVAVGGLLLAKPWFSSQSESLFRAYLARIDQLPEQIHRLPPTLLAYLQHLVYFRKVGFVFPLLLALLAWRRDRWPSPALLLWLAFSVPFVLAVFLVAPEPDLQHQIRSSMARLVLPWTGPAWILAVSIAAPRAVAELRPSPRAADEA